MNNALRTLLLILTLFFLYQGVQGQRTVGLLKYDPDKSYDGFNLFFPHNQSTVFLMNNCGEVVHGWADFDNYRPGNAVYLMPDGSLLKCKRDQNPMVDSIWAGGGGAIVESRNWSNSVNWSFEQNNDSLRLHHDIAPLPNGNVLMISWELKSLEESLQAGRNPELIDQGKLWPDYILEYDPSLDSVVWEWHAWDHLIQDFDPSRDNFGVVGDHPEKIDINFDTHNGHPDWMHANAIDYNPVLDQILISVPYFHEVWVIDHSTTTEEAASDTGGRSGMGGDLLYRWGNPVTYRQGTYEDQKLFFPHDIRWVKPEAQAGEEGFGLLSVFNNRVEAVVSTVNTFQTGVDPMTGLYSLENNTFMPASFSRSEVHPEDSSLFHSTGLSSNQVLPNENLLVLSGRWGRAFELTPDNEIVWDYVIPIRAGQPVPQGEELGINNNITFQMRRYSPDYGAFTNRDLTLGEPLELNAGESVCNAVVSIDLEEEINIKVFPNPVVEKLSIEDMGIGLHSLRIVDLLGKVIIQKKLAGSEGSLSVENLPMGMYLLEVDGGTTFKFLKQ